MKQDFVVAALRVGELCACVEICPEKVEEEEVG